MAPVAALSTASSNICRIPSQCTIATRNFRLTFCGIATLVTGNFPVGTNRVDRRDLFVRDHINRAISCSNKVHTHTYPPLSPSSTRVSLATAAQLQ